MTIAVGLLLQCDVKYAQLPRSWEGIYQKALAAISVTLCLAVCVQWLLIRWFGDYWWLGTIVMFLPRWPLLAPLAVVSALCLIWRRRLLWVCLASAFLLVGPVMGFCVPRVPFGKTDGFSLRILTANLGGGAEMEQLRDVIERERPDIIAFQELGKDAPETGLGAGWHWMHGAGTAIASRYPIVSTDTYAANGIDRWGDIAVSAEVELPHGRVRVCSVHLNTPRWGLGELAITRYGIQGIDAVEKNTHDREMESRNVRNWVGDSAVPTFIAGDFNMPVESAIYRYYWSRFQNTFSAAGWGYGHTKFTRLHGVRIDHILADEHWDVMSCHVGGETGGDHRPVVADLMLPSLERDDAKCTLDQQSLLDLCRN